jgi:cation transport ATPase
MKIFFIIYGFILWLSGTILFILTGQYFLNPESVVLIIVSFLAAIPIVAILTYPFYSVKKLDSSERKTASMQIALPGMILNVLCIAFFASIFKNMMPESGIYFGSLYLWIYSLVLISGFYSIKFEKPGKAVKQEVDVEIE